MPQTMLQTLAKALMGKYPATPIAAADALGDMGKNARVARSALITATRDPDENVSAAARRALSRIPIEQGIMP